MRKPLVAGNWKMHGLRADIVELVDGLNKADLPDDVEVAVFPPFIHVERVVGALSRSDIKVGAQDCAIQPGQGALTGEVSASQLRDLECKYVLVGHSERRLVLGESDQVICDKFVSAQSAQMIPVLCVGETREQREAGETFEVVREQLGAVIDALGVQSLVSAVVAYEPVWAIGTGLTATPDEAQAVHAEIRALLSGYSKDLAEEIRILYGGSVKATNAAELFGMPDIDGGLVGGASLNADEFSTICRAAGCK
ncbi:triosephosphate isomerase [Pseudomonas duriflava]|uniref:Triosephosphate isomerase n=1 Tax=Pseudomonas duriflava TaxID=459528 RepID=A0A562Q2F4_9PSED|nr:triose-phosphate isomerase [Pseudomonas duriflava]TWI50857.1 triosephosphate isomerase [Pseudomonas duriflava]